VPLKPSRDRTAPGPGTLPSAAAVAGAGALLLAAALGIGRFAYTPLLPPMREHFGWTVAQAGDLASANYLGYLAGALLAAALVQRRDRWGWLAAGMMASAATCAGGALIDGYPAWLAIRFLAGVASALCLVIGTAIVFELLGRCQRPALGALHFGGLGAGIVASVLVIEALRRAGMGVHGLWGALGLVSALLLAVAWRVLARLPGPEAAARAAGAGRQQPMPPALRRLVVAYGLFGFGYVVTATFIVAIARRQAHAAVLEPLTWIVVGLLAAPSVFVWQRVVARVGLRRTLRAAFAVEAVGVLLAGCTDGAVAIVVGGALLGGTFAGITALGLVAARRLAGPGQDGVLGWMTASFGLGQLLGPAVAGRLAQASGDFVLASALAAGLLATAVLLLHGGDGERAAWRR